MKDLLETFGLVYYLKRYPAFDNALTYYDIGIYHPWEKYTYYDTIWEY